MKVLLCSTTDIGGGAAKAAYRLLNGLLEAGIDAKMLVLNKKSDDTNILSISELISTKSLLSRISDKISYKFKNHKRKRGWAKYPNRSKVLMSDLEISSLNKVLNALTFDILHLHWVQQDFINLKELQKINKPIVMTMHDCYAFTGICHYFVCKNENYKTSCGYCPLLNSNKEKDISNLVFRQKATRYNNLDISFISPSNWLAEMAKQSKLLANKLVTVIPNGISTEKIKPIDKKNARKALNLSLDKKYILYGAVSATSDPRKGFNYLSEAFEFIYNDQNENIDVMIFGTKHENNINIGKYSVINLGYIQNERLLVLAYSAADVMVVPSLQENLPNTILESLACGTPVVAFNIGGNKDMISHKQNGYLALPYEPEDLSKGIKWCLYDKQGGQLQKNARKTVTDSFSYPVIIKKHTQYYQQILSRKRHA